MEDVFPQKAELSAMLQTLPNYPTDPSMAVIDPLCLFEEDQESEPQSVVDSAGYSSYARIVTAMLLYFTVPRFDPQTYGLQVQRQIQPSYWSIYYQNLVRNTHSCRGTSPLSAPKTEFCLCSYPLGDGRHPIFVRAVVPLSTQRRLAHHE